MKRAIGRREFVALTSSILGFPFNARAQLFGRTSRIGFLTGMSAEDVEGKARVEAFLQGLVELGWSVGDNLEIDYRAAGRDPDRYRTYARELIGLKPDILLAGGAPALAALLEATRSVPIVFANATDSDSDGYLVRLARPRRNTTGIVNFEPVFGWRFLELLKQLAPQVTRVGVLRSTISSGTGLMASLQAVAPKLGVELSTLRDQDATEMERSLAAFVQGANHGLIVTAQLEHVDREQIIALAALYRLPAVYAFRRYVAEGGLISYGTDQSEPYRQAAGYIDRIIKGERPIDLPVRALGKYEITLNKRTAESLGLNVPAHVLARVNEVVE